MPDRWETRSVPPRLEQHVAQLWRANLSDFATDVDALSAQLPVDEQQQADRFTFASGRQQFVVGRAMLRTVLATQLAVAPQQIVICISSHGKPEIADPSAGISFNLSHSGDIVMLAIGKGMTLGIDVEHHREVPRRDQIARGIFGPAEQAQFEAFSELDRQRAFFSAWTRKEAVVKAMGRGLSFPLSDVEVTLSADEAKLLRFGDQTGDRVPWRLRNICTSPGYSAALATDVACVDVFSFRWQR